VKCLNNLKRLDYSNIHYDNEDSVIRKKPRDKKN
jgi:hypothetical protein